MANSASSAASSRPMLPPSAIRRASDCRTVRTIARLAGTPLFVKPARMLVRCSVRPNSVRARFGSSRSSKKICMNSSRDSEKTNESSLSPSPAPPLLPPPAPPCGRAMRSPATYSRLPGRTNSRSPPRPKPNDGSEISFVGTRTSPPFSMSARRRSPTIFFTAAWMCDLYRRRKRSRLTALLPRLEGRRSISCSMSLAPSSLGSGRLVHAQIPLGKQAHLLLGVALRDHTEDEILMLLALVRRCLGVERDDRQQVLGVREHLLLDDLAQLLVAAPRRVPAVVVRAGPQHEVDDLVAKILRIGDARRLLDLLELGIQRRTVEAFAGLRIPVVLFLDPAVRVGDVTVEDFLAVFLVRLEIGRLDLLPDERGVPRREIAFDVLDAAAMHFVGKVLAREPLLEHVHQVHGVGGDLGLVVVEDGRQYLVGETRGHTRHTFVGAGVIPVFLQRLRLRVHVLQRFAVVNAPLRVPAGVLGLLQPREHRELRQHFERSWCTRRTGKGRIGEQLVVDLHFLG